MSIYTEKFQSGYNFDDEYYCIPTATAGGKKAMKLQMGETGHIPNKNEAQELRKIMASTGLSEEEVRQDPKYRKQLSEAQKAGQKPKRTETQKTYQHLIKAACKQTGLVPQHPETIKALQEILDKRATSFFCRSWWEHNKTSAEQVVKEFAKK